MKIKQLVFWFKDEVEDVGLYKEFSPLGELLERLLSEVYVGKKIMFFNIFFSSKNVFIRHPELENHAHFYNGNLFHYPLFNFDELATIEGHDRKVFVWQKAHDSIIEIAKITRNNALADAIAIAYQKGLNINLNPDFYTIQTPIYLFGADYTGSIWFHFVEDGIEGYFVLEKNGKVCYSYFFGTSCVGNGFFLTAFKKIEQKGNTVIIKGIGGTGFLPQKIVFTPEMLSK